MQKKIREMKMFLTGGKLKCQFYVRIKIEEGLWFRIVTNFLYISMTNTTTCWCKKTYRQLKLVTCGYRRHESRGYLKWKSCVYSYFESI